MVSLKSGPLKCTNPQRTTEGAPLGLEPFVGKIKKVLPSYYFFTLTHRDFMNYLRQKPASTWTVKGERVRERGQSKRGEREREGVKNAKLLVQL